MEARMGRDAQRLDATHDSAARHRRETHKTKFKAISGLLPTSVQHLAAPKNMKYIFFIM